MVAVSEIIVPTFIYYLGSQYPPRASMGRCLSIHYFSLESKKLIVRFLRYSLKDSKFMWDSLKNVGRRVENVDHRVWTSLVFLD